MEEDNDDNVNPDDYLIADSAGVKGIKVNTTGNNFEEFLNEYKFANIKESTGEITLADEDLDGKDGFSCDTELRINTYTAETSQNVRNLYIIKHSVIEESLHMKNDHLYYDEVHKKVAMFTAGNWASVREI